MASIKTTLAFTSAAATLTLATLSVTPAQAAIATGSVTGTWNDEAFGAFTLGNTFTATYSYDDATISPFDNSDVDFVDIGFTASLLTLNVNSGSYSHNFDFTNGGSEFFFRSDYALKAPTYIPESEKLITVFGVETSGSVEQYFSAGRASGLYKGVPTSYEHASAGVLNPDVNSDPEQFFSSYAETSSDVKFSPDPTAVPTPTYQPTKSVPEPSVLIGLGLMSAALLMKKNLRVKAPQFSA